MTLRYGIVFLNDFNEVFIILRVVESDKYKRGQFSAELFLVNKDGVLFYNARDFELFDTLNDGGGGKIYRGADCSRVFSRILFETG